MEHLEAIFEWSSMNGMGLDEADFMAQLLGNCTSFPNDSFNFPTFYASSDHDQSAMYTTSDETNDEASMSCYSFLQGDSVTYPFWPSTDESDNSTRMDISCTMEVNDNTMKLVGPTQELSREVVQSECKKRSRVPAKNIVHRSNKRSMKKLKKCTSIIEENSSSCCTEEDDSNASASASCSIGTLNSNGKIRAGRGSATDPQSLYARKRREKISERLRILQKLVPNGTKVDISTMLEEAVDYVKFLQLQIKLLSSDDLWMYAPIAYNGMELGLDLKMAKYMCS